MSRSNKDRYEKPAKPPKRHIKKVLCDNCGEWYPEEDITLEVDAVTKQVTGRFCYECF